MREANLLCVQKVKWLGWVPEVTKDGKHMRNRDGSLRGNYMCGWLTEDDKIEETKVAPWWAEIHFGVVALAYAQQKAY